MAWSKEKILINIENLMRSKFTNPKEAFEYFDTDNDGQLTKADLKQLLKEAKVSSLIRGLVAEFVLNEFDKSKSGTVNWEEFKTVAHTYVKE
ncbi:EF-hand domain-containing protein [Polaribacter marinivivus]|uniref:EF-hand domain-containing protein n=1 Tax=Polaribacter marinivivus TaxID=1524260 RepID=UPI003D816F12